MQDKLTVFSLFFFRERGLESQVLLKVSKKASNKVKVPSSFEDDLAMSVGSATTLSFMMLFRSHSSRQRRVSPMTDQPMELWFGYFCIVLPRRVNMTIFC